MEDHTPPSGEGVTDADMPTGTDEDRAQLSTAKINDLPDSDFAYIEPGGEKDDEGKTTPRSLRHFPIHDEAHVRNALARAPQSPFGEKAMPKIKAAAKKFGIDVADTTDDSEKKAARGKQRHRSVPLLPEVRMWNGTPVEVRQDTAANTITLTGTPIVYDTPYQVNDMFGSFTERMAPGVCSDVLSRNADVRFMINHAGLPLARTASGTMTLRDTASALEMTVTLDSRQGIANDLMIAIQRGDVAEMSCGFIVARDEWNEDFDQRTIQSFAELLDVSAVTFPASPTTSIELVQQRMADEIPEASRARVRKLYIDLRAADLRAGKTLSGKNQDQIAQATKLLHGVLSSGGFDPASLIEGSGDEGMSDAEADGSGASASGAGTGDEGMVDADGSGFRTEDPGEKIRSEKRTAVESYSDAMCNAQAALSAKYGDDDGDADMWVCDMSDSWIVFTCYVDPPGQGTFQVSYTTDDDGAVVLGDDCVEVIRKTTYDPVPDSEGRSDDAPEETEDKTLRVLWLQAEARKRRAF